MVPGLAFDCCMEYFLLLFDMQKKLQTFLVWFGIENKNSGHFAKLLTSALLHEKCFQALVKLLFLLAY